MSETNVHTYNCNCKDVVITEGIFGEIYAESSECKTFRHDQSDTSESWLLTVKSYTMINKNSIEIVVISWGATIVSVKCPDKYGSSVDVALGFDDMKSYMDPRINPFIGCVLGRCANRIKHGYIVVKGKTYQLAINDMDKHHLHGGTRGFGRRLWQSYIDGCSVVMTYLSESGEEGYPGALLNTIRFTLTPDNKLEIGIRATTTNATIVNISHGSLFNLAGHDAGKEELMKHQISLNCDRWTFADYTDSIPTGSIRGVAGTIMDLRIPKLLKNCVEKVPPGLGYDHNFCVTPSWHEGSTYVAQAVHSRSGRVLEVYSNQPGVHFYTGGRLSTSTVLQTRIEDDDNDPTNHEKEHDIMETDQSEKSITSESKLVDVILGKHGASYAKDCAFSIQPQNYPNAINYSHFPYSVLLPGEVYCHDLTYKFGIQLANYL